VGEVPADSGRQAAAGRIRGTAPQGHPFFVSFPAHARPPRRC
jgi:hypothetical protein